MVIELLAGGGDNRDGGGSSVGMGVTVAVVSPVEIGVPWASPGKAVKLAVADGRVVAGVDVTGPG